MAGSILEDTKKILGLSPDYTAFDVDLITHINTVFSILNDLGIGPEEGFAIEDDAAVWSDFLGDNPLLNPVKTYMYLKVRMMFDPPATSYMIEAMKSQIQELEWRLNRQHEGTLPTT